MKNKRDENIDSLFLKTKEIPTEIPLEKLEKMILDFPGVPVPTTESHWFVKLFNLKYIAMTIIPLIAALTFLLVPEQPETTASVTKTEVQKISEKSITSPKISVATEPEKLPQPSPQLTTKTNTTTLPSTLAQKEIIVDLPVSNAVITDELPIIFDSLTPHKSIISDKNQEASKRVYPLFDNPSLHYEYSSVPDLSNPQLKKLRRTLYRNLKNDGILPNKKILVDLQLFPDQILVNEQPIPEILLIKYRDLTRIVGVGPDRKIKMSPDFILAGDFGESGFHGNGYGTIRGNSLEKIDAIYPIFQLTEKLNLLSDSIELGSTIFPEFSLLDKLIGIKKPLDMESNALDSFANIIQQNTPKGSGRKRLPPPNLEEKGGKHLHATLKIFLEEDGFVNTPDEFAVIQLPKDIIRINGTNLDGEILKKYQQLINEYGIKHGRNRVILFSPHFLKAGNYNDRGFRGIISILPFRE